MADIVDDPYEPGAKLPVVRNVSEHPLTYLHARGRLHGAASMASRDSDGVAAMRFDAGTRFRSHYERAIIGGAQAIDYSRVKVDGGQMSEPLSETVQASHAWLNDVAKSNVGAIGYAVLVAICGEGKTLPVVALKFEGSIGLTGRRAEGYVSGRLIEALDALAQHLGLDARPGKASTMKASGEITITGPGIEWEVGRFGQMIERKPVFAAAAA